MQVGPSSARPPHQIAGAAAGATGAPGGRRPLVDESADGPVEAVAEPERAKGVVRLLEAGHFSGTAELRLRTNHADQLEGVTLPPVEHDAARRGQGYQKAIDAYRAVSGANVEAASSVGAPDLAPEGAVSPVAPASAAPASQTLAADDAIDVVTAPVDVAAEVPTTNVTPSGDSATNELGGATGTVPTS